MKRLIVLILFMLPFFYSLTAAGSKIIIEFESNGSINNGKSRMVLKEIGRLDYPMLDSLTIKEYLFFSSNNLSKWVYSSDKPLIFYGRSVPAVFDQASSCVLEPGDSIHITAIAGKIRFSGKGSEKFEALYRLNVEADQKEKALIKKSFKKTEIDSVMEFMNLKNTLISRYQQELAIINQYKGRISDDCLTYIQSYYLKNLQFYLTQKYMSLFYRKAELNLSNEDVAKIYDTIVAPYTPGGVNQAAIYYWTPCGDVLANYAKIDGLLKLPDEISSNKMLRYDKRCEKAREMYSGLGLAKTLIQILVWNVLYESVEPDAIAIINKYMPDMNDYPEYQQYVRDYLKKKMVREKAKHAPVFTLKDVNDKPMSLSDLKGKTVFMDFWFTGCKGCVEMSNVLRKVEEEFKGNEHVKFLSISIDKNKEQWLNSIAKAKYTSGTGTNLYTGGMGNKHPVIDEYAVMAYPAFFLINEEGEFIKNIPDPRHDNGKGLITLIKKWLPKSLADGPYVLHKGEKTIIKSVVVNNENKLAAIEAILHAGQSLHINTDRVGKTFEVRLKNELQPEPAIFKQPSRLLAISDIEGNFYSFKELLLANKVIDEDYNWTFGDGNLVLIGDFFDRGYNVTEVLWLIYSLEDKAKAKGGYVHFILGNHELMNLAGDTRYVKKKYIDNADLLDENYSTGLYGKYSELGRWLRTKNIMEQIGDVLYLHAGVSPEINKLGISIKDINDLARINYAKKEIENQDVNTKMIISTEIGPFWYRGYYKNNTTSEAQIDSTLQKFKVNKIATGHTIIDKGERVTTHFNGKVINTDTHHADGKSEGLYIEHGNYYRADMAGKKIPLFENVHSIVGDRNEPSTQTE